MKTSTTSWFDNSNPVDNIREHEINTQVFGGKGTWSFQMIQNNMPKDIEKKTMLKQMWLNAKTSWF